MIYDIGRCMKVTERVDSAADSGVWNLDGGLWIVLLSVGNCFRDSDREDVIGPGCILLGSRGIRVRILEPCRFLGVKLGGSTAEVVGEQLEEMQVLDGGSTPGASEAIRALYDGLPGLQENAAAFRLLCLMGDADSAKSSLPPLVTAAVAAIRENYPRLYGLEELSEQLNVSREHLVRLFRKSMGISPGRYLNRVRMEHAKEYLLEGTYTLDVIATLCGYSGANYFCRAFRRETGIPPARWRAENLPETARKAPVQEEELMLYL